MADPTPDVAIIVYPTEDELRRCGSQVEPIHGINIHLPSEYLEALQAYTDAVVAKVLLGVARLWTAASAIGFAGQWLDRTGTAG
jgi:hypothetical protein